MSSAFTYNESNICIYKSSTFKKFMMKAHKFFFLKFTVLIYSFFYTPQLITNLLFRSNTILNRTKNQSTALILKTNQIN